MAYSEAGSSSDAAQASGGEYQVFLSLRGPDTRREMTDSLYHSLVDAAVGVFRADEEVRVGEEICGNVMRAINSSVVYIPIFSRGYASSKSCLRELALIVDNVSKSEGEKSIIPIFYDVDPADVRLETPLYRDALLIHEKCRDEVEGWRAALEEVGKIKGWSCKRDQSQAAMVKLVVEEVLVKLRIRKQLVTTYLVGLDDRIEHLEELLDVDCDDVRLIGIFGMGGMGKTTIAKVIFNKLCPYFGKYCSFLMDVHRSSIKEEGIVQLQKKLLSDIGGFGSVGKINDSGEGMSRIGATLSNKKVLLVLDDVDDEVQIKSLIANSKLHGGSRIIITTRKKGILCVRRFVDKVCLYKMEAMEYHHALQLFYLHAFCKDFPRDDYSELSREIVSCTGGQPLVVKVVGSLLKGTDKRFWEETLIRLREVPKRHTLEKLRICYDSLDNYQRQIFLDIACFFVNENKTNAIYMWDDCELYPMRAIAVLTRRNLIKVLDNDKFWMHDLLIDLGRQIVCEDSLGDLQKQSRLWIAEEALKIIHTKKIKNKVQALVIDGPYDSIEITNEDLERLPCLRLLKLGNGTFAGDFARCVSQLRWISWCSPPRDFKADNLHLDRLVVFKLEKSGFTDDSKAWNLIKRARNLKVLSLIECDGITMVPDVSRCMCLERLTLARCNELKRIETFIGDLRSLMELEVEECIDLADLPEEVGALVNLKRFSLRGCSRLRELPSSIGNMTSLVELDLSSTRIAKLPNSIQELVKLKSFLLGDTRIRELPNFIGKFKSLRVLRLSVNGFSSSKHVWQLPSGISMLKYLEELDLSGCVEMKGEIPIEIGELSYLRILNLRDCHGIRVLPELPTSLTCLLLQSRSLLSVSNLSNLTNLVELLLSDDSRTIGKSNLLPGCDLRWIGSLSRLKKLVLNLLNVPAPPELATLSHLEELTLCHLDLVHFLSFRWALTNLSTLGFYCCEVEDISLDRLPKLEKLTVYGCKRLMSLSIPLELKMLRLVCVSCCPELVEIQVVGRLESLESLRVLGCGSLRTIGGLSQSKNLEELEIQRCNVLTNVEGLREPGSLKSLVVKGCTLLRWSIAASYRSISSDCPDEMGEDGDSINQSPTSLKAYGEDIHPNKLDMARHLLHQYAAEGMEDMKDEVRQQAADMDTLDRNYVIAAVQSIDGIDDRVKQIIDLLEMEINDEVRIIGIYGIDGIGKTTLAKAVYDCISSRFDSCSFLAEVKETAEDLSGIQFLKTKLIRDFLKQDYEESSFDEEIELFLDIFRELKVLIVVDDVEKQSHLHSIVGEQLHWFGPGSRIVVTSQNKEILKEYDPEKACTYMVSALDDGQIFELFCKHAFRMQSCVPDYAGLANRIVNATEKLPLAVEVVGSFLRGKSIQEWEKMEKSMKQFMMKSRKTAVDLEEILDICYKELDQQQKDIFLDIASFISSVDARIASYMWPNYPSSGCILMPLAKIGENNELQMHSSPRRLGKRILDPEGSGDPVGRKFYIQETGPKAISGEKGMKNVEPVFAHFTAEDFRNMPDIRFLKLDNAKVSGNFAGAFASLRWLCWQRFPLEFDAFNFVLGELVILDLSWSKVTEYWGGWSIIKMEKLKVLNLTGCSDLLFTPDFSVCKDLEILILERCSRLVKLDPSIGHLKCLDSLNLKFCSQLNGLPVELGCMTALKELFIDGSSVQQIPISIGNLKQLKILSGFKCFPLTHLPSSISYLPALSELSLDGAKITELPSSLGQLLRLRQLSLKDCRHLEELPDSIGEMRSLAELDISATNISELPNSIVNLDRLKVLRMDYSFIQAFPGEIGNLTSLEELNASWCRSLKGAIPCDIKELHNLKSLILGHSSISSLPSEISTITGLHTLDLLQCNEIEVLPELPPSLISLRVSSKRMKVIPLLKGLKELEEMCLSDEDLKERQPLSEQLMPESNVKHPLSMWFSRLWNLEFFQTQRTDKQSFLISFPKLRKLELSLSQIIKLKFELTNIPQLKTLTLSGLSLKEVSALPKTLSVFKLYHSAIKEIEGLEGLKALKRLDISDCKIQTLKGIGQLTSLRSLILSDCDDLSSPDLSNLVSLKVLEIRRCKMIHQIEGLEKIASLEKLNISECPAENSVQVQNALKLVMARSVIT